MRGDNPVRSKAPDVIEKTGNLFLLDAIENRIFGHAIAICPAVHLRPRARRAIHKKGIPVFVKTAESGPRVFENVHMHRARERQR